MTTGLRTRTQLRSWSEQSGMLIIFVVLFCACALFVENFFSLINMKGLALAVSMSGMVACPMLFCLASGDFDLSIGATVACAGVVAAMVSNATASVMLGVLAGIAFGAIVGALNGVVIAKFKINALIATLAAMQIVRGLGYIISGGNAVGIQAETFFKLGNAVWLGVSIPIWSTLTCFLVFGFVLNHTRFGRYTLAIGGNAEAARLSGVPVTRIKILIFMLQGLVAGFAGVVLAARMTSGQPMTAMGFELEVISACVLGGVSLAGGVGAMRHVIAGVLLLGMMQNAMNLLNVPPFYQYVARGMILLVAVLLDRFKQARE